MTDVYKVGSLSEVIQKSSKSKKKKSDDPEISKLASLFSAPSKPIPKVPVYSSVAEIKPAKKPKYSLQEDKGHKKTKDKKQSKSEQKQQAKITHSRGYDPPPGIVHEALLQKSDDGSDEKSESIKSGERKPRHKNRRDRTKDTRTVFVGNLPISYDKKKLKKLFKSFGKIESVRFRCPPPADLKLPKRAIAITKTFHKDRQNIISYVCFQEEDSAQKALKLNGEEIDGFHIRVDISTNAKKHDKKNTVFVGNMPYDVTENDVWNHFEDCGEIANVRIIRDNKTGTGKGIGYVLFKDKDSAQFALKLNQSELKGRQLRVQRCDVKAAKKDAEKKLKGGKTDTKFDKGPKKMTFKRTNKKVDPFQHLNKTKKKHLKKKNKARPSKPKVHTNQKQPQKGKDRKKSFKKKTK